jgi:hypothetical protein
LEKFADYELNRIIDYQGNQTVQTWHSLPSPCLIWKIHITTSQTTLGESIGGNLPLGKIAS